MSRVIVYHGLYGCDTGCCGHVVELDGLALDGGREKFLFDHPWKESALEFAQRAVREAFGEEHVAGLDWEHCNILDD